MEKKKRPCSIWLRSFGLIHGRQGVLFGDARTVSGAELNDLDGAIADYTEAVKLKPDDSQNYLYRGQARYEKENVDGALADFTEVVRLEPASVGSCTALRAGSGTSGTITTEL